MQTTAPQTEPRLGFESRQATDPRCVPITLYSSMPEGEAIPLRRYTDEENETWKILYARQRELLAGRACKEFMDGLEMMEFSEDRIPSLVDVHRKLKKITNWSIALA